jgi:hypothetical protein
MSPLSFQLLRLLSQPQCHLVIYNAGNILHLFYLLAQTHEPLSSLRAGIDIRRSVYNYNMAVGAANICNNDWLVLRLARPVGGEVWLAICKGFNTDQSRH